LNDPGSFRCVCPPGLEQLGVAPDATCECPAGTIRDPDVTIGVACIPPPTTLPTTDPPTTPPPTDPPITPAPGECSDDSECGVNEICVDNECVCREGFMLEDDMCIGETSSQYCPTLHWPLQISLSVVFLMCVV